MICKIQFWALHLLTSVSGFPAVAFLCCIGATTQKELQQMPQSLTRAYLQGLSLKTKNRTLL